MAEARRAAGDDTASRLATLSASLGQALQELPREDLPTFFAELERLRRTAELRLHPSAGPTDPPFGLPHLLDAKQTAAILAVDTATVYRMAKGALRSAVVEIGEGTLRFEASGLRRFIEARRR